MFAAIQGKKSLYTTIKTAETAGMKRSCVCVGAYFCLQPNFLLAWVQKSIFYKIVRKTTLKISNNKKIRIEMKTPCFIFAKSKNKQKFEHFLLNFVS
jgi:hypothetical protein